MREKDQAEVIALENSSNWNPWNWKQFNVSSPNKSKVRHTVFLNPAVQGFLCSQLVYPETEIQNICVDKNFRRKKVATSLLEEFIHWCEMEKFHKIFLEVRENNKPARDLYRNFQFELMDIRKNYYSNPTDNAYLYTLQLN